MNKPKADIARRVTSTYSAAVAGALAGIAARLVATSTILPAPRSQCFIFEGRYAGLLVALVVLTPPWIAAVSSADRRTLIALAVAAAVASTFVWSYVRTHPCGPL